MIKIILILIKPFSHLSCLHGNICTHLFKVFLSFVTCFNGELEYVDIEFIYIMYIMSDFVKLNYFAYL